MNEVKDTFLSIIGKPKDEVLITKLVAYILNPANTTPNNDYTVHFYEKFNCFQIWKNSWNTQKEINDRKGIHYEIVFRDLKLYELNYLSKKNVEVSFVIHNESKSGNKISTELLKRETYLYDARYDLDNEENIEKAVINIALKMKELSEQNDTKIDKIVENAPRI